MVGWAIQQRKAETTPEGKEELVELKESLRGCFKEEVAKTWPFTFSL